jgi:hypothetical protein
MIFLRLYTHHRLIAKRTSYHKVTTLLLECAILRLLMKFIEQDKYTKSRTNQLDNEMQKEAFL